MSSSSAEPPAYEPKETAKFTTAVVVQSGVMGAIVGALQTSLSSETGNWWKKMYRSTGLFAAMGGTFALTQSVLANTRRTDDALNGAAGACAAGFLAGVRTGSIAMGVSSCAVLAAVVGTFEYAGGELRDNLSQTREERRNSFFKNAPPPLLERHE